MVPPGQGHTGIGLGGKVQGGAALAGNTICLPSKIFCLVFSIYLTGSIQPGIFYKQRRNYLGDS